MAKTPGRSFHTASDADTKRGLVSDVYFSRTVQILEARGDRRLELLVKGGQVARDLPPPRTIREFVLDQLRLVSRHTLRRCGERSAF